jgi:hypothetical protein
MDKKDIFILENEERLLEFKNNAYKAAHEFSIEKILPKYEEMYKRAIKNGL